MFTNNTQSKIANTSLTGLKALCTVKSAADGSDSWGRFGANTGLIAGLIATALATRKLGPLTKLFSMGAGGGAGAGIGYLAGKGADGHKPNPPVSNNTPTYSVNFIDPSKYYVPRKNSYGFTSYSNILKDYNELMDDQHRQARRYGLKTSAEKTALNVDTGTLVKAVQSGTATALQRMQLRHVLRSSGTRTVQRLRANRVRNPNTIRDYGFGKPPASVPTPVKPKGGWGATAAGTLGVGGLGLLALNSGDYSYSGSGDSPSDSFPFEPFPSIHPADRHIMGDPNSGYDINKHGPTSMRFTPPAAAERMNTRNKILAQRMLEHNQSQAYNANLQAYIDWFRSNRQGAEPKYQTYEQMMSHR